MTYQEVMEARRQALYQLELADTAVKQAAALIAGRLRSSNVAPWVLRELKRELKNFNMTTSEWKS